MIRRRDNPAILITQTAHGWLAGQIALHWGNHNFQVPALRSELILAAANHDNGWLAWEQAPKLDDQGRPVDFVEMSPNDHIDIWQRSIYGLAPQSRYAAILVSMHGRNLIDGRIRGNTTDSAADTARLSEFSAELVAWEAEQIDQLMGDAHFTLGCQPDVLQANLRLLQIFDWLSLLLSMDKLMELTIEDVPGATATERVSMVFRPLDINQFTITPWPFARQSFSVTFQARTLPQPTFSNQTIFHTALQESPEKPLNFEAVAT